MKLFKRIICKMGDIFNLPRFSKVSEIKIPKFPEIVPTDEYKRMMREYFKNINFKDVKVYINGKQREVIK